MSEPRREGPDGHNPEKRPTAIPLVEIVREHSWRTPFQLAWHKAHELGQLNSPFHEESDMTETLKLRQLRSLLERDLTDTEFVAALPEIRLLLPSIFSEMAGIRQRPPHLDVDPVDHTFNALSLLNTESMTAEDRLVARTTLIFHDTGKYDGQDRDDHPATSADLADLYLSQMGFGENMIHRISTHIRWHDYLGQIARRDGRNILNPQDVIKIFPTINDLRLHRSIVLADVGSIPGLNHHLPNLEATYMLLEDFYESQSDWIWIIPEREPRISEEQSERLGELVKKLHNLTEFDDIDITTDAQHRRDKYDSLPEADQLFLRQALVTAADTNDPWIFPILRMTGRETDRTLVTDLETEFNFNLDSLRAAVELYSLTYNLWTMRHMTLEFEDNPPEDEDDQRYDKFSRTLREVIKSACLLSPYVLEATHVTTVESEQAIKDAEALNKSETRLNRHYEGDGVYAGAFGGFKDWDRLGTGSGTMFTFPVRLADCLPILQSFKYPRAMVSILAECVDLDIFPRSTATPHGLVQWLDYDLPAKIPEWKVRVMESTLRTKIRLCDDDGLDCLVGDVDYDPIVWGSVCRALRIRRFIPMSEIRKSNIGASPVSSDTGQDVFQLSGSITRISR